MAYVLQFAKVDTLAAQMSAAETASATLTAGAFGSPTGPQLLVVDYDNSSAEVIGCAIAGTALSTITRAKDGTSAVLHAAGAKVGMMFVPSHYEYLKGSTVALTDGANIAWNLASGNIATVTLAGNRTLDNPTNLAIGTYILKVVQDGTGSRTLAYGNKYFWAGGTNPVLSTAASSIDIITFYSDGTNMYGSCLKGFAV